MGHMLRRLFMALLIVCLAAPAMAAPLHCAPPMPAHSAGMSHHGMRHGHGQEVPAQPAKSHDCIGCIAPASDSAVPPAAGSMPKPLLSAQETPFSALASPAPETPPPRA